jgi:hypothetical protein
MDGAAAWDGFTCRAFMADQNAGDRVEGHVEQKGNICLGEQASLSMRLAKEAQHFLRPRFGEDTAELGVLEICRGDKSRTTGTRRVCSIVLPRVGGSSTATAIQRH